MKKILTILLITTIIFYMNNNYNKAVNNCINGGNNINWCKEQLAK